VGVRLTEIVIDSADPRRLAEFWSAVLGWPVSDDPTDDEVEIRPAGTDMTSSVVPSMLFIPVPETKTVKNRLHLDVSPVESDQETELARLLELGATRVDIGQGDAHWHVLADPEGNEFCLLRGKVDAVPA
jgi:hypothetical protein